MSIYLIEFAHSPTGYRKSSGYFIPETGTVCNYKVGGLW